MATASLAALRSKIELDLRGRVLSPFNYRDRNVFEVVSTGIPEVDAAVGGLPRGAMTEICGPPCSGRTSLLISTLAARTADGEACALVDARDSFDPALASEAGVALQQLLWVRCQNADQALRAADLLIQGGGFGLVIVDLSDIAPKIVRYVPLNAWFRFRKAVEDTPTILLVVEQEANAKTCASLVLRLKAKPAEWSEAEAKLESGSGSAAKTPEGLLRVETKLPSRNLQGFDRGIDPVRGHRKYPFGRLLRGFEISTDVVRSRVQAMDNVVAANDSVRSNRNTAREFGTKGKAAETSVFQTATPWSVFQAE